MPNIIDILARAQSLMNETALNSITPPRAGGIMYDTLLVLNQMQLEGASLLISKVYASVSAMEADTTPTSDLTGRALKPGQLVVIVTSSASSSDMGSEYRYNGPGSWTYVGKVGGLPLDTVPTQNSTKGITSGGVYALQAAIEEDITQLEHEVSNVPLLEKVFGDVINFAEETLVNSIINNSTGKWQTGSSGTPRFCYIISAQGLQGKRIYVNTNAVNNSRIAFLTTNAHTNATDADFCSGYSGTIRLRAGAVVDAVIPSDCNYIYIGVQSGSSDISANNVWTSGDDSKEPLNFLGYMKKISGQYISSSTYKIATSSAGTLYLVKPYGAKKVFIHVGASDTGMMSVAFYSTDEISAEGYMSGLTSASGHTIGEMEIPDGCKLIAISNRASTCANPEVRLDEKAMMNYLTEVNDGIIGEKVNLDDLTIKSYYISPSSNKWSSGGTSYLIPVVEGQKMYIRANPDYSVRYAFLTTDTIVEGDTPSYVASTGLVQIIKGNYDVATTPAGCTHLYIYATYSTNVFIPKTIILGGQITELAEDLKKKDGPVSPFSGKKILCIGDSWGRDSFEELWSVANDAGVSVEVYDAYQGGSSLLNQYKGMDDPTRHYTHGNFEQYVQGTYQLWNWSENLPSKTPADSVYHNGKCGIYDGTAYGKDANNEWVGMTLAEILSAQDWDIINIRLGVSDLQTIDKLTTTDDDKGYFILANFIARMEAELTPACLAKVKWSISNCWSWPVESAGYYTPSARVLEDAGIDADWSSMTLEQKQEAFVTFYNNIQKNFQLIAKALGNKCAYIVNTAKALQLGRDSHLLGDVAFKMVRSSTDMHLGNGVPKYICGCCFAYNYLAITCGGIFGDYVPDLIDGSGDSDGGAESNPTTPTKALCAGARKVGWKSFGDL